MVNMSASSVDILVSNAGIASSAPVEETSLELWNKNMEDMEQKENEAGENDDQEDKEEIDLGDR